MSAKVIPAMTMLVVRTTMVLTHAVVLRDMKATGQFAQVFG